LVAAEKEADERYIASTGRFDWLVSFAPKGMAGEIDFYLLGRTSIFAVTEEEMDELLRGLARVFAYFNAMNLISFDLTLYGALREDARFPIQGRIIPRYLILPLGASDINYFEKLHDEIICPVIPERLSSDLRPYFQEGDRAGAG
jgi:UDPglucose--hexose-1-phosphate uridylyltransferase